jgi:DNA polymerase III delta prime subunit
MSAEYDEDDDTRLPWMEKHRPTSITRVRGKGAGLICRALYGTEDPRWRADGDAREFRMFELASVGDTPVRFVGGAAAAAAAPTPAKYAAVASMVRRMLLIGGPPGCGKTSAAMAVFRDMGASTIEINCSLTRGSSAAESIFAHLSSGTIKKRKALLLEELDNMDTGAQMRLADMIGSMRDTICPLIATCNHLERIDPTLASVLVTVQFPAMETKMVADLIRDAFAAESEAVEESVVRSIAASARMDARRALNDSQLFCEIRRMLCASSSARVSDEHALTCAMRVSGRFAEEAEKILRMATDGDISGCSREVFRSMAECGASGQELFESIRHVVLSRPAPSKRAAAALTAAFQKFEMRMRAVSTPLQVISFARAIGEALSQK